MAKMSPSNTYSRTDGVPARRGAIWITCALLVAAAAYAKDERSKEEATNASAPAHFADATKPAEAEKPFDASKDAADKVEFLRQSGGWGSASALGEASDAMFATWLRTAQPDLAIDLRFEKAQCYAAGCYLRSLHGSREQLEAMTANFYRSTIFADFPANVGRSAPIELQDGHEYKVSVYWFVTPP